MTFFKFLLGVIFMGSLIAISGKAQTNRFNYNKYTNKSIYTKHSTEYISLF